MGYIDVALAPIAGLAAGIATTVLTRLVSTNPWARRAAGAVGAVAGTFLSATVAPRVGAAIASGALDAAVKEDIMAKIEPHLPPPALSPKPSTPTTTKGVQYMNGVRYMSGVYYPPQMGGVLDVSAADVAANAWRSKRR